MKSCNIVLAFPPDVVVWMIHKGWGAPERLAGVWKENASPQKSPSRNHGPRHDRVWLASQLLHHRQTGMEHSETSQKRRRYLGQERHARQRLEQLRVCSLGWVTAVCATGLKTQTCLHPPSFVQAPQMYNYHIAHAHVNKIIPSNILAFTNTESTSPSSSTENGAMGIGLEYV